MRSTSDAALTDRQETKNVCLAIAAPDYSAGTMKATADAALALWPTNKPLVGKTVLLKVNALSPKEPDAGVTTHPELVKATALAFQERGAKVWIGDSSGGIIPGGSRTEQALQTSGMAETAMKVGAELVNFDALRSVTLENPRGSQFPAIYLAQKVLDADYVVSMAKLKTHSYTLYTGGMKNLYGCVPGGRKAFYHGMAPTVEVFSEFVVDIFQLVKPTMTIIDGVIAMEGAGPAAGDLRYVGGVFASTDTVALDACCCRLMGISPDHVSMLRLAVKRGLGSIQKESMERRGAWDILRGEPFKGRKRELPIPQALRGIASYALRARPEIIQKRCIRCKICLHSCPVETIVEREDGSIVVEPQRCIQCCCCHELCPKDAIQIKTSAVGRLLQWAGKGH